MKAELRSRARRFARALDHSGEWLSDPLDLLFDWDVNHPVSAGRGLIRGEPIVRPALDHRESMWIETPDGRAHRRVPTRAVLMFSTLHVPTPNDPPDWVVWHAHNFYLPEIIETAWGDPVCAN